MAGWQQCSKLCHRPDELMLCQSYMTGWSVRKPEQALSKVHTSFVAASTEAPSASSLESRLASAFADAYHTALQPCSATANDALLDIQQATVQDHRAPLT